MESKNILILSSEVPYAKGGAEVLVDRLASEVNALGHAADIVSLPFICNSNKDLIKNIAQWRSLDVEFVNGRAIDCVICTKFPTYYIKHPTKILWLVHQYRQAYDLVATRFGDFKPTDDDESIRKAIIRYDNIAFSESRKIYTISETVSQRLKQYNDVEGSVLEPPISNSIDIGMRTTKGNYILCVGRLSSIKRVDFIIRALPQISNDLNLAIVGKEDEPGVKSYLRSEIDKNSLSHRVTFYENIDGAQLSQLYADCFCVYFGSFDEDFGFVTYEAAKYRKPIVTLNDSGHIAFAVTKYNAGVVCKPDLEDIPIQVNRLLNNNELYDTLSRNTAQVETGNTWKDIVNILLTY